jgi:colanic acid/amylovoran biosynthesis glycosyltransferase
VPEFPVTSETFIVGQVVGLLTRGYEVEIISAYRKWHEHADHPEIEEHQLLSRTHYIDMPDASAMELAVLPIRGETWLPGASKPIRNISRVLAALPAIMRTVVESPRLARDLLDPRRYGESGPSLSAIYRFNGLRALRGRYDIVHAHFGPVANDFRFAPQALGVPLIVTFHGYDFSRWPHEHGRAAYHDLFEIVGAVTVNSDYAERELSALGCPAAKLIRLNVAIDVESFEYVVPKADDAEVRMLTVGRLVPKKGMADTILALSNARQHDARLRLEIVGDGPLRADLTELVANLNLHDFVTFHGFRDSAFVRAAMRHAHVFVLASRTAPDGDQEGTPVVLMEAMASGVPVISTRHSGIPEMVVDGRSGLLVDEGNVQALAASMVRLASDTTMWEPLARAARQYVVTHHALPAVTDELISLYETVMRTAAEAPS